MMYKKLVLFRQCISGNIWPWWVFTQIRAGYTNYCKTLFRLMCSEHGLNTFMSLECTKQINNMSIVRLIYSRKCTSHVI